MSHNNENHCFIALGTKIQLLNGNVKDVENVQNGDTIIQNGNKYLVLSSGIKLNKPILPGGKTGYVFEVEKL